MNCKDSGELNLTLPDGCCNANTGCDFDGSLRKVKSEPIYVQKVYDAALFNLQGLRTIAGFPFMPALGRGTRITRVLDIRCRRFFNPDDIGDERNLRAKPDTEISGGQFVKKCDKGDIEVVGPDGFRSEKLIFADTTECDRRRKGTPIFGTQNITITGNVIVEIDVLFTDDCDKECEATLSANIPVAPPSDPLFLTNFFELCIPSVFNSAFLPRFTEFCNISCQPRLATNNIRRDLMVDPLGRVSANLIISLCVTCEKKIIVPVQLCVLSTGFPVLAADVSPICSTFPTLFPEQIDEKRKSPCCDIVEAEEKSEYDEEL